VNVIPGQKHNLAGAHLDCGFTFDGEKEASLDDEVVGNQKHRLDQEEPAVLGGDVRVHAPRSREVSVKEDASCQANRHKDVVPINRCLSSLHSWPVVGPFLPGRLTTMLDLTKTPVPAALQIVGWRLCEPVDLRARERVLDFAAGNGNATCAPGAMRSRPTIRI
jgi:hypothetical protein